MPMSRTCLKEPLPPGTSCTDTWNSCVILRAYDCVLLLSHPPWQQCKPNRSEMGILVMKRACSVDRPTLETRVDLNILKIQSNKWIGLCAEFSAVGLSLQPLLGRSFPSFVNNRNEDEILAPPETFSCRYFLATVTQPYLMYRWSVWMWPGVKRVII